MQDNRLRIGMKFLRKGQEFIIIKPVSNEDVQIKNTRTDDLFPIRKQTIVEELFAGKVEIIGEGRIEPEYEKKIKRLKISDITVLDENSPWRIETRRRYTYVQRLDKAHPKKLTKEVLNPIILEVSGELYDLKPPSWQTLKRWYSLYLKTGKSFLILIPAHQAKGNRNPKFTGKIVEKYTNDDLIKAREVDEIVDYIIRNKYLSFPAPSIQSILDSIKDLIAQSNKKRAVIDQLPEPHLNSIFKRIQKLDKYELDKAKYGKEFADKKYRQHQQGVRPTRPLERVEFDHTVLDLMVIDLKTHLPLGRPCITALIDVYTKNIIGIFVSFYQPGYLSVMKCLLHAIKPKSYLKEKYPEILNEWLCYGLPELLVVDNALEFYSQDFIDACAQLGISIQYAPVKKAWFKVSIERFFRTENQGLIHTLPGTTFSNIFDKEDYDAEKNAVISFDSLLKLLQIWIVDDYHQRPHRGIKDLPAKRWRESIGKWEPNLPPNNKSLQVLLGFIEYRTVTASGIELFGLHYNCHELSLIRRFSGGGAKELIKYDPDDISHIYCYNRRDDEYLSVPALEQEYTDGLTLWQHNAIKKYNQRVLKNETNSEGLLSAKETMKQVILEDISALKTTSKRQKFMRLLNVSQPDFTAQDNYPLPNDIAESATNKTNLSDRNNSFGDISKISLSVENDNVSNEELSNSSEFFSIIPIKSKSKQKLSRTTKVTRGKVANDIKSENSFNDNLDLTFSNLSVSQEDDESNENWSVSYDLPID